MEGTGRRLTSFLGERTSEPANSSVSVSAIGIMDNRASLLQHVSAYDTDVEDNLPTAPPQSIPCQSSSLSCHTDQRYSLKVFVGGLPYAVDEETLLETFSCFGQLEVYWPHKATSGTYVPHKGFIFLVYVNESSVLQLIDSCTKDSDDLYFYVPLRNKRNARVQIRPWLLSDAEIVLDASLPRDPRKTVFVGGVYRSLKAADLALAMNRAFGGVCSAEIDVDLKHSYPKGTGRVTFSNQSSYLAAIRTRFVSLWCGSREKKVEIKPLILNGQTCDECRGQHNERNTRSFLCPDITCLKYYCGHCWLRIHSLPGRQFHSAAVKKWSHCPVNIWFQWW